MTRKKRKTRTRVQYRLPDPMRCRVYLQTARGVIITAVIADFTLRPFQRKHEAYWISWSDLGVGEMGLLGRGFEVSAAQRGDRAAKCVADYR